MRGSPALPETAYRISAFVTSKPIKTSKNSCKRSGQQQKGSVVQAGGSGDIICHW